MNIDSSNSNNNSSNNNTSYINNNNTSYINNNNTIKKSTFCNNCGKSGHLFHQCRLPITSLGLINYRIINNNIEILLIRRKDSLSFVDFIRGKYCVDNINYIINLFNKMTIHEKNMIKNNNFNYLWNYLWGNDMVNLYQNEEKISTQKFNKLKEGIFINNLYFNIDTIISKNEDNYLEPEWGFPKGRRNYQEKDINCAIREFEEETGYKKSDITLINNLLPIEEIFMGSNYKSYKHKYYISKINTNKEPENYFQTYEISKIEWVNIDNVCKYIREYNIEKKKIINDLNKLLKTYKVYI